MVIQIWAPISLAGYHPVPAYGGSPPPKEELSPDLTPESGVILSLPQPELTLSLPQGVCWNGRVLVLW